MKLSIFNHFDNMNHYNFLIKRSWSRLTRALNQYSRHYSKILAGDSELPPESCKSMEGLVRCAANHVPLSPIGFLERSAKAYRDNTSLVYGCLRYTWGQTHQRCLKVASALTDHLGISPGDVVSSICKLHPFCFVFFFFRK